MVAIWDGEDRCVWACGYLLAISICNEDFSLSNKEVEKGTNGTDSEFYNPKKKAEKEYLTFLSGFRQLAPRDAVLNNLALSDVDLQDLIASADSVTSEERKDENGQVYYVYEIDGVGAHSLISVTCANNKLHQRTMLSSVFFSLRFAWHGAAEGTPHLLCWASSIPIPYIYVFLAHLH
ncbi:hypothetical protein TEA_025142 [Camellia sinensis var. sinensis]|uniref:Uncharacterized protein n=1 Tax=Camellia sinensis var. sinensis TaxID=542762 RepID=A0A4S4DHW2_CAMSN|nr:hypothetical protein TEA_025142 [Camellia sinensis var. sinensis]